MRPELRVRQVFSACTFCKARKIKCDGIAPGCGGCTKFGRAAQCSLATGDGPQGQDYPSHLLERIAVLQNELRTKSNPTAERQDVDPLVADIGALPILASSYPSSIEGPTLSTIVLGVSSRRPLATEPPTSSPVLPQLNTSIKLVEHYVEAVYPRLPFFSLFGFWAQFGQVFQNGDSDADLNKDYSYFTVLLVLAISTSTLSRSTDSIISSQSNRLFQEALRFRESAIVPNTITGIQSLLFLIQYATLNPSVLDAWYLIGVAMRTCINLGLHQDPPNLDSVPPSLLETRRRLWWSVYSFDRSMSIGCGRPTEVSDEVIGAQLPSFRIESTASDDQVQGYLQRYRALQLQSRIYDELNREGDVSVVPRLAGELALWKMGNAEGNTLLESEWLIGNVLLYRPCRLVPERSPHDLEQLWVASTGFLSLYRQLVEGNGIFYTQIACEKAYFTGLAILYSFWKLKSRRSVDLWMAVNNVLYVLRTLSERWENGKSLTDEFDRVSSRAIRVFEQDGASSELSWQIVDFGHHASVTSFLVADVPSNTPGKDEWHDLISAF